MATDGKGSSTCMMERLRSLLSDIEPIQVALFALVLGFIRGFRDKKKGENNYEQK